MQILSVPHEPVKACVTLEYRGFTLSLTTIVSPEMQVFRGKQCVTQLLCPAYATGLAATAESIRNVMGLIDSLYLAGDVTGADIDELIGLKHGW